LGVEFESTPRRFAIAVQGCTGSLTFGIDGATTSSIR